MLQLIFQWLMTAVAKAMEVILNLFMQALDMDMNTYITLFPFLSTGYTVFRGIGIGLAIVLSSISLLKFMAPGLFGAKEPQDTVIGILVKTFFSAALIYGGNFILVKIVNICKIPYDIFLKSDAVGVSSNEFSWDFATRLVETLSGVDAAAVILQFFLVVLVSFNLLKLMIEVCERYMLVGIMVYTSPPFFALVASGDTIDSFKRWAKMFISACAMMTVSVFFLKLILSGFSILNYGATESAAHMFVRLFLLLATCKIAQRVDSYLSQLGFGTAKTGGNLLDDIIGGVRGMGRVVAGGHSSHTGGRETVLGAAANAMSRNGGLAGKVTDGIRAGTNAYASGDTKDETLQKIKEAYEKSSYVPNSVKAPADIAKGVAKADTPKEALDNAGAVLADQAKIMSAGLSELDERRADSLEMKEAIKAQDAYDMQTQDSLTEMENAAAIDDIAKQNMLESSRIESEFAGPSTPDAFTDIAARPYLEEYSPAASDREALDNYQRFGSIDPDNGASMTITSLGDIEPSPRAKAAGITIETSSNAVHSGKMLSGNPAAAADIIAGGYNPKEAFISDVNDAEHLNEFKGMAMDTVSIGDAEVSDRLLHNPNMNIGGVEGEEIGAAAVKRLYPDIVDKSAIVKDLETFSFPTSTDTQGHTLSGGHAWSANVTSSGQSYRYTAIDRAAFTTLSEEERRKYVRYNLPTGRTDYIRKDPIEIIDNPDNNSVTIKHSHYTRTAPARNKPSYNSNRNLIDKGKQEIIEIPDRREDIRRYEKSRRDNRPNLPQVNRKYKK